MQYNTRRKSISLQALGIQIPQTSRVHRTSISKPAMESEHPAKRLKREHSADEVSSHTLPSATSPVTTKTVTFADRPLSSGRNAYEHTPPPSPGARESKIDYASINDDIVAGVIEQLDKTGNRPHLIKELASVLSTSNADVARSANPAALLSSRLASYMRRSWTADYQCPVAKELIPVHPRKVFYYLTTSQRQELPASALEPLVPVRIGGGKIGASRIITPSLSNASQDDEASNYEERKRAAISPSPEVELGLDLEELIYSTSPDSASEFLTPPVNGPSSFISTSVPRRSSSDSDRGRAPSPALDGDEKEFTATARDMKERGSILLEEPAVTIKLNKTIESIEHDEGKMDYIEDTAQAQKLEVMLLSSPMVKAISYGGRPGSSRIGDLDAGFSDGFSMAWDIRRPQSVGFDELDDLFDHF